MYKGWWVAVAGTSILALLLGSQAGGSMGLFFVAPLREFKWSRTLLSGAFTVVRIEGSFLGPVEGILTDRLGSHRMAFLGFLITGFGFFILAVVSHPIHFYLALLFITGGVGIGSFIPVVAAVNWWFTRRRNRALGLAMAGVGMGALWSPLIAWGITTYGWRIVALTIGIVLLATGLPLSRAIRPGRSHPSQGSRHEVPTETEGTGRDFDAGPEFTLRQAMRTRAFWLIPLAHMTNGFTTSAVYVHGIPHLVEVGFTPQTAGYVMATYGLTEVIMRVFGSFIGDRVDKRYAFSAYCIVQALGMVALARAETMPMALLFAVLFAVGHGGRGPIAVAIRGEYFGRRRFGTIMGIGSLITSVSGISTPLLLGVLFDIQGTYVPGFLGMAALTFSGGFLMLGAVRPSLPGAEVPRPSPHLRSEA